MIPFFEWFVISFGPIKIHVWGFFVALGFLLGIFLARWKFSLSSKKNAASANFVWDLGAWIVLGALAGARLGHVFFYSWPYFSKHLKEILSVWDGGMSSYGGFIGGTIAFWVFVRIQKVNFWRIAEAVMWAFPFGMMMGRIGCFLTHEHLGKLTKSVFGVQYPGGARFDMGLLEIFALVPLAIVFFVLRKKEFKKPVFVSATLLYYGVSRFFLDFLRATDIVGADARYAGLTPAQYGSIVLAVIGCVLIGLSKKIAKGRV